MKQPRFHILHMLLSALAGALAVVLLLWLFLGVQGMSLLTAWGAVRLRFVGEYDPATAADSALYGLVGGLGDRWSYYLNAEANAELERRRSNVYVGIGVTVSYGDPRGLTIELVAPGTPAEKAGLQVGEIITGVDGASLEEVGQAAGLEAIQGKAGTDVLLTVLDAKGETREVSVDRVKLERQSVSYELLEGGVGYIKVVNFYSHSAEQLNAAVDDLADQGAVALVFDMRNNGGGYVDELTDMLDHLLPEGPIFRSTDVLGWEEVTKSDKNYVNLPMATLVNGDTYSAAEFFAAQLQETVGAYIVGSETSGKGYSQQSVYLPNGGTLNISTGKYTTGAGNSLVGTGVSLDAEVDLTAEESYQLVVGVLEHEADPQLQKALELLG